MNHWVLLIKRQLSENSFARWSTARLIAEKEEQIYSQISRETKRKWLLIGLLESLPVITGFILSQVLQSIMFSYDYLVAGILITGFVVKYFLNKTPLPPIHLQQKQSQIFNRLITN